MLPFWPSDAVLVGTQAALVCGPRPRLPRPFLRLEGSLWGWLLLPLSLGGTIAILALIPRLGIAYAWLAQAGVPVLAAISLAALLPTRLPRASRACAGGLLAGALFALAWIGLHDLSGQAAAVALTALSVCTLASYLAQLTPRGVLKIGLVAMATLDAILVFGHLLQGPNATLNAATPGHQLPHLQVAVFGSALIGYGDLFVAAVLGNLLDATTTPRRAAALLVLGCSGLFDLLFLAVDELPATVPVAVALLVLDGADAARRRVWRTPVPPHRATPEVTRAPEP